jgi:hypothetical protein
MKNKFILSKPVPVRMPESVLHDLSELSDELQLSQQEVIRFALSLGVTALNRLSREEIMEKLLIMSEEK